MVQPVTNEHQAQTAAEWIRTFTERRKLVQLEEACLTALIDELTRELLTYRQGQDVTDALPNEHKGET